MFPGLNKAGRLSKYETIAHFMRVEKQNVEVMSNREETVKDPHASAGGGVELLTDSPV